MASTGKQGSETRWTREATVLAPDLQVGDRILETGLAGVIGLVTALRVGPEVVDVTTDVGMRTALARFEVCRIQRAEVRS